jgi:hypothetical protein
MNMVWLVRFLQNRGRDSPHARLPVQIPQWQTASLRLGYSYDVTTSVAEATTAAGSHEVMLNYCFKIVQAVEKLEIYRNTPVP